MRLVTYEQRGEEHVGLRVDDGFLATGYASIAAVLADGADGLERLRALGRESGEPVRGARLLAPHPHPGKMLFCGRNYNDHVSENPNAVLTQDPFFFAKLQNSIIGPGQPVVLPSEDLDADYEGELLMVIGSRARNVSREHALTHVFGYTIGNDVSARAIQFTDHQITLGKGLDTFCPMGPDLALADEVPDPEALTVTTWVNGERRQHARTADMIHSPAALIEFLSATMTLEPGDVVSTGTPAGVGCFRDPPAYLRDGDEVTIEVAGIGSLTNPIELRSRALV
jgi:2-keto-4-pentenoate hydratase/2-oxohepta-3-ene-1,7-dioic acid hydratase in catechol pathway